MADLGTKINAMTNGVVPGEFLRDMLRRDPVSGEVISSVVTRTTIPPPGNTPLGSSNNYDSILPKANEYGVQVLNPNGNVLRYYKQGDENAQYAPRPSDFLDALVPKFMRDGIGDTYDLK